VTSGISITINIPGAGDAGDLGVELGGISLDTGGMTPPPSEDGLAAAEVAEDEAPPPANQADAMAESADEGEPPPPEDDGDAVAASAPRAKGSPSRRKKS